MLPFFNEQFANPGSITHEAGREARVLVDQELHQLAEQIGASRDELVVTSGATESSNLAILGACLHPRQKRRKVVSLVTEHRAVLDPLKRLGKSGFDVRLLTVSDSGHPDLDQLADEIGPDTAMVSVMMANNEVGTIIPLRAIADLCQRHGVLLHTDATQAVGRIALDVHELGVDLMSFSAHKFYGPKGVGGLFVRRSEPVVKLLPQIVGGGQQNNWRSGTLNVPGIVGMSRALQIALQERAEEQTRIAALRDLLYNELAQAIGGLALNGPPLDPKQRLVGNLNCCFWPVEGQSLLAKIPEIAASSGSACTSEDPGPSHVLLGLGLSEDQARCSLRFGIGRFNTEAEIRKAIELIAQAAKDLQGPA